MNNMIKEQCIHFDGIDKSGKDTIADNIIKATNGRVLIFRRSYISQIVYAIIYNRNINYSYYYNRAIKDYNCNNDKFFLFTCNEEELIKRFQITNEKDLSISDIEKHIRVFNKVKNNFINIGVGIIEIDTSYLSIEDSTNIVLQNLKVDDYD